MAGTVELVPSQHPTPLTIDALVRVVAERDAEVALLKLMVDKLKAQLARRAREQYGSSSEQLTLIAAQAPSAPTNGGVASTPHISAWKTEAVHDESWGP